MRCESNMAAARQSTNRSGLGCPNADLRFQGGSAQLHGSRQQCGWPRRLALKVHGRPGFRARRHAQEVDPPWQCDPRSSADGRPCVVPFRRNAIRPSQDRSGMEAMARRALAAMCSLDGAAAILRRTRRHCGLQIREDGRTGSRFGSELESGSDVPLGKYAYGPPTISP